MTLSNPVAPATMVRTRYYTVYALLKPRHAGGTTPVRFYKYRYYSGHWNAKGYVVAFASDWSTYTKCSARMKLSTGWWRLRSFAPEDGYHGATWSKGYTYVTVR